MKQIKILGVLAIALTLGLASCNKPAGEEQQSGAGEQGESQQTQTSVEECKRHTWGDWVVVTPKTCTTDGSQKRTCSVCGKEETKAIKASHEWGQYVEVTPASCSAEGVERRTCSACQATEDRPISKLDHTWGAWETVTAADCTNAGSRKHECEVCHEVETEAVQALGHQWVDAEDQTGAVAPTCTEAGTKIQKCSRDGCNATQTISVDALGHDFPETGTKLPVPGATETNTKGEVPFHWAEITNYSCTRGDSYRYAWSAKEVNFDYKTVADGAEPELLDVGEDGIRFWGRPIGNAMVLSSEGRASGNDDEKIPDESVKGSRFEFDFVFDTDVNDVCLSALLEPAEHTNDIFKNRSQDQEWTPGYRFVDDDNDPETPKVAQKIEGMRFIIYLDGVEVELDDSVNTRPNGTRWYQFPCKLNLTAGKHNLNIAMAGGYLHTFYQFSFEKVAPAHQHNFVNETKVDKKGDGYVDYYTATCAKEGAQRISIAAMDGTFADGSNNKNGTLAGYLKLNSNGNAISYKFDWAGQAKTAKLYQYGFMDNFSSNGSRTYTSKNNGDLGPTGCNFGVKFNNTEVEIDATAKTTTYSDFFSGATVSPGGSGNSNLAACLIGEVSIANGDNTFTFTRYNSFNLSISYFYLVIEA